MSHQETTNVDPALTSIVFLKFVIEGFRISICPQQSFLLEKIGSAHTNGKMSDVTASNQEGSSRTPCAACKTQRKKCTEKCVLAPYFPPDDLKKFELVHKLFGNGHVVKFLQNLPAEQRGDAVNSMVYEASQRIRDPVHGCVGVISDLQKKVAELQTQLASTQAAVANISQQHADLLTIITGSHEPSDLNFFYASPQESVDTEMSHYLQPWELF